MNNIFSISRFAKVAKSELSIVYGRYIKYAAVLLGIFIIDIFFTGINFREFNISYHPNIIFYTSFISVLCVINPFIIYKYLFHRISGVSYTMLPASNTEKYFFILVHSLIIVPLFLILVLSIYLFIFSLIFGFDMPNVFSILFEGINFQDINFSVLRIGDRSFFDSPIWAIIGFQSLAIWGVCFFKNKKFLKTVLSFICFGIVSMFVIWIIVQTSLNFVTIEELAYFINNSRGFYITLRTLGIIFPFLIWGWAYYKFTRQQI